MRTIIAGSRTCCDYDVLIEAISKIDWNITTVISGGARGVDKLGEKYARAHKIPLEIYPAEWDKHGKAAGYIRNEQMAKNAEALLAVWDGHSKGTKHMIDTAHKNGLKVYVHTTW